ncbi:hypothetical protein SEA_PUPPER_31 [Gordonia phage Pupper]|uniref:Uncharacterized protein n=1 Tax=Gordonia phage Pupper TaxID=2571249 RepID=A0A4Y6EIF5_9CAUD|nr:hypothetical protein KHQ83_gp031 [Gordonia phage Pupper]QDF18518.1 hypothetical protein SEA_PUPPER_31 [Gordonia phage Pupper]QDF18751.1 hypothetical protein SEA_SCENTAE_31 [Gordonia phage SCentae]
MNETPREMIKAIFAEELAQLEADHEPTPMITWIEQLRDKVLDVIDQE